MVPLRFHSLPHCCSSPPFSELGKGTCTCRHPGTDTCTRWHQRAECCRNGGTDWLCSLGLSVNKHLKKGSCAWKSGVRRCSPFHEVNHVHNARSTDHRLVCQDGPHGLFHTELWLQRRQKRLNLLPEQDKYLIRAKNTR